MSGAPRLNWGAAGLAHILAAKGYTSMTFNTPGNYPVLDQIRATLDLLAELGGDRVIAIEV